jgi:hypothetical protein
LRVFYAVEREEKAGRAWGCWSKEVFDREKLLRTDEGYYALVSGSLGELGQLLARFLADADAGGAAEGDEGFQAGIVALAGHEDVIETPAASLEGFFDRMQAVENFHSLSVEDGRSAASLNSLPIRG